MKTLSAAGLLLGIVVAVAPAAADGDDKAACFDAAEKGQALRNDHKLVQARKQFPLCAAPSCPTTMQKDCSTWLDEVEKAMPTVVLSAKDAGGNDVIDVVVTMDGQPLATKLDGTAIAVDPGAHTFRFEWPDGTSRERQVLIAEWQKALVVAVALPPLQAAASASASVGPPPPASTAAEWLVAPPSVAPPSGSRWRTVGWIAGGVGVAGLAVGAVFTGITISDKNAADCNAAKQCTNYPSIQSARNAAPVAGAGLIGGAVLIAAAGALLLFTHQSKETAAPATGPMGLRLTTTGTATGAEVVW
jgi:hypothetical protein